MEKEISNNKEKKEFNSSVVWAVIIAVIVIGGVMWINLSQNTNQSVQDATITGNSTSSSTTNTENTATINTNVGNEDTCSKAAKNWASLMSQTKGFTNNSGTSYSYGLATVQSSHYANSLGLCYFVVHSQMTMTTPQYYDNVNTYELYGGTVYFNSASYQINQIGIATCTVDSILGDRCTYSGMEESGGAWGTQYSPAIPMSQQDFNALIKTKMALN